MSGGISDPAFPVFSCSAGSCGVTVVPALARVTECLQFHDGSHLQPGNSWRGKSLEASRRGRDCANRSAPARLILASSTRLWWPKGSIAFHKAWIPVMVDRLISIILLLPDEPGGPFPAALIPVIREVPAVTLPPQLWPGKTTPEPVV